MPNHGISLLFCIAVIIGNSDAWFTGFGDGTANAKVEDYLGITSMLPLYMAMFKEMNNFGRQSGGDGSIGLGTGQINSDGSITYPAPAPAPSSYGGGSSSYGSGSYNGGNAIDTGSSGYGGMNMMMNQNNGQKQKRNFNNGIGRISRVMRGDSGSFNGFRDGFSNGF
ncbi:hypothetical protein BV898_02467 [Hypsibius exemplaris]|uniref:Uncharacterized protein n=1 Tax=Hypsibius exemplaris TaxID=2072580 RepID=A0A1W0X8M3_HYPEX|nr:hypothetical protein BV898_02467 [Hypsibius exemplaris]